MSDSNPPTPPNDGMVLLKEVSVSRDVPITYLVCARVSTSFQLPYTPINNRKSITVYLVTTKNFIYSEL